MEKPINIFIVTLLFLLFNQSLAIPDTYNILDLGAKPDGKTDSSKSLLSAWAAACDSPKPATIFVPKGRYFVKQAQFLGPCKNRAISFRIDGTLVVPSDYKAIGNANFWLQFQMVDGVSIRGGILDGQGTGLWGCKASGKNCPSGTTTLGFTNSNNIAIAG
ncbi:polygalacturonase-like [Coffea eugenioides]|uniref:polygalacturonase-like n=1 Tax=Coffea eugenioides TaxID=49369 RepID=UPI000F6129EE|nr:polygalacturonase-like [Coffea eugenioides]